MKNIASGLFLEINPQAEEKSLAYEECIKKERQFYLRTVLISLLMLGCMMIYKSLQLYMFFSVAFVTSVTIIGGRMTAKHFISKLDLKTIRSWNNEKKIFYKSPRFIKEHNAIKAWLEPQPYSPSLNDKLTQQEILNG